MDEGHFGNQRDGAPCPQTAHLIRFTVDFGNGGPAQPFEGTSSPDKAEQCPGTRGGRARRLAGSQPNSSNRSWGG